MDLRSVTATGASGIRRDSCPPGRPQRRCALAHASGALRQKRQTFLVSIVFPVARFNEQLTYESSITGLQSSRISLWVMTRIVGGLKRSVGLRSRESCLQGIVSFGPDPLR
jgi:hypothetical protein